MPRKKTPDALDIIQQAGMTHVEPRCNICKSTARTKVDRLLAAQFSYTAVAEELVENHPDFQGKVLDSVRKNVERHSKSHLDVKNKAIREIVERRAREQGILLETATGKITSGRALLDLVVDRATEQIINPDSKVKYADALEAVKMLEDVQRQEYLAELERMTRQVMAISQAVKEMVPESMLPGLISRAEDIFNNDKMAIEA